jgi:hypothetical protein
LADQETSLVFLEDPFDKLKNLDSARMLADARCHGIDMSPGGLGEMWRNCHSTGNSGSIRGLICRFLRKIFGRKNGFFGQNCESGYLGFGRACR